ncbi:ferritin-like domain-containing protein [Metabacillus idriensis]|uniref:Ferritin-like domain-containing protein n=1 Tax=Metabacillus idriensis TaxID=324768 RepID=A0A6I2M4T7_9BACI|nr:ferritin-like domain-containing protein [Metabacillus idriensis]MCM3595576.1 ferritin-like domain-containing protein [Metabacillus idriensis]MRX52402.1 ferritin-like domain-containing protein [Metabacillus idriensis]OHR65038.1 rubrerythrin family protein [Bacillus sp. HMSC76G11]
MYSYYRANQNEIDQIAKALAGEYNAIQCYEQMANMAKNEEEKKQIMEIRNDEIKHYQTFAAIYQSLSGMQYNPKQTEECPGDYYVALTAAFKDEQETVDFYLDIAENASSPYIRKQFKRASADEQNHAVWFLYYLMQNR